MKHARRNRVAGAFFAVAAAAGMLTTGATAAAASDGGTSGRQGMITSGVLLDLMRADVRSAAPVTVEITYAPPAARDRLARSLGALGARLTGEVPGALLQADVQVETLGAVAALDGVTMVRPPLQVSLPIEKTAPVDVDRVAVAAAVTGQEVTKTNAAAWQAAGHTGKGIKIGVVDAFYGGAWSASQNAGELVPPAGKFCRLGGANCGDPFLVAPSAATHGVMVAEIVHEMAPDAQLYIATVSTASDLQAAVDYFAANGVKIITRSLTAFFDGPGDGTGPLATVVDSAVAKGMVWFNSVGNSAGQAPLRSGSYWRGQWVDADNDGNLDFAPGVNYLRVFCGGLINGLRWDDWVAWNGGGGATDYDVLVYDNLADIGGLAVESNSSDRQVFGAPPVETTAFSSCGSGDNEDYIQIRRMADGPDDDIKTDTLELMGNQTAFFYWSNPYSATQPVSDSANPGEVSVGAIDPANGTTIGNYSSQGPTNDGRIKPDMAAASCVTGFTIAATGGGCFAGTSASAPTAAGAAALVLSAGLAGSPAEIAAWLYENALVDRDTPGNDNRSGRGELVLPGPPGKTVSPEGSFHAVAPTRIYDSRTTTKLAANDARPITVAGVGGVPSSGAAAVVVNITVTETEADGYATAYPCGTTPPLASNVNFQRGRSVANVAEVKVGSDGQICVSSFAAAHVIVDLAGWYATAPAGAGSFFHALSPARIVDSRSTARVVPGAPLTVGLSGRGGLPSSPFSSAVVNITVTNPTGAGYAAAYPCGTDVPAVSNVNFEAGQTVANLAVVSVSQASTICIATYVEADVIVDVSGWYGPLGEASGAAFTALAPNRLLDTRAAGGPLPTGATRALTLVGAGGVASDNVTAVVVNVTAVDPRVDGYLTAYPCGSTPPLASTLNFRSGVTVANLAVVSVGTEGRICFTGYATDVVVDVSGFFV
ncbi:MAG: S8 family serine peptidase [Acidimicrobiia bacterium]